MPDLVALDKPDASDKPDAASDPQPPTPPAASIAEPPSGQPPVEPPRPSPPWSREQKIRAAFIAAAGLCALTLFVFLYYYVKFARMSDQKLENGVFASTLNIFAAQRVVGVGDRISENDLVA
jgi:hypothetical protein